MGGTFLTRQKRQVEFSFPEFSTDKTITWIIHVDDRTDDNNSLYDMIIGTDLMSALGMKLDFETKEITWEGNIVPMKTRNFLSDRENTQHVYESSILTDTLKSAEDRHQSILDANYSQVDIDAFCNDIPYI